MPLARCRLSGQLQLKRCTDRRRNLVLERKDIY
jgi:hypothetical protein